MMSEEKKQPIIIKKVRKGHHGRHGGAWKVAYADFVTAMMAFFLLLWLLETTTMEVRAGISQFFRDPSVIQGPGGASTSMIKLGGSMEIRRGEGEPLKGAPAESRDPLMQDQQQLDELMERLKEQIENSAALHSFTDQLFIDITSEGLRIQIVDKKNRPMFDLGSDRLKWYTRDILHEIAQTIRIVPNFISVTGHTDAVPYASGRKDYGNWELSSDRANAARRELVVGGLEPQRFGRIVGFGDTVLFDKDDPVNPMNRRISIVVLNRATERALGLTRNAGDAKRPVAAAAEPEERPEAPPARRTQPEARERSAERAPPTPVEAPAEMPPMRAEVPRRIEVPGVPDPNADPLRRAIESILGPPPQAD